MILNIDTKLLCLTANGIVIIVLFYFVINMLILLCEI